MIEEETIYSKMTKAEREVADYLQEIGLYWRFEFPIFVFDERDRPRVWTPDFYLPELGIYIEVCGSEDFDYDYRQKIYFKNKIQVVFIHQFKHEDNWKEFLKDKIISISKFRFDKTIDSPR